MAHLLVEVGNTALKAAWAEGTTLGKTYRYQGEKMMPYLLSLLERERPEVLTVASASGVSAEEEAQLRERCAHLLLLDRSHTDLLLRRNLPEYLSYDRAAGLVAAGFLFKDKPVSVFDFGTTLTVDFLSREGRYLGGNISPGCRTRFKALERYSKTLPLVDTPEKIDPEGTSIRTSIESGVISGIMFEIEGYTRLRPENIVIFTGGDAIYFAKKMKNSIFVVCNLVLMGLALITDDYVKKNLK
ncbi:MAG: type III pantothenate kinase [Bacteroidales bacterium]|nr:type III pantothenate kinase [Bacteroidales bacterium]